MAIFFPDILENNNTNYPLVNVTSLKGTAYPLASISNTGSIPADKRNVGAIVFDSGSGKFYGFKGSSVSNWDTGSNWIEFGSGSGGGSTANHLFDRCIVNGFTYDGYNPGDLNLQFVTVGSTLNGQFGENLAYRVGDKMIVYIDDKNYIKGTVNQVPGGFGVGSINVLVDAVIGTTASNDYCITLDLTRDSYVYNTQTGSFLYSGSYNSTTSALTLHSRTNTYNLDLSGLAGGSGGGFPITASNQGSTLTENARSFDFVGNAVTATNVGSAVTVTINTGSASTPVNIYNTDGTLTGNRSVLGVDKTLLFQMSGSSQFLVSDGPLVGPGQTWTFQVDNQGVYLDGLLSNTPTDNIVAYDSVSTKLSYFSTSSLKTDITALNNFSGSANTRLDSLEAATGSYVTNAKTGSFYYSSSISSNVITFNQGDGTTESITIVSVPSASFAPNLYNSDDTLTGNRVLTANGNNFTFNATSSASNVRFNLTDSATFEISGSNRINLKGLSNTTRDSIIGINVSTGQLTYFNTSSIQNVASASHAPNIYNSNGTLTGDRLVSLGTNNELRITPGAGASEFRVSDGPSGGPFIYEVLVSGSGEFRINSPSSASFVTNVYISPAHVLTLAPRQLTSGVGIPTGSFAVSSSVPPRPYMWDGTAWYAL